MAAPFIHQGDELDRLMVICAGKACVMKDGKPVEELGDGQFIGGIPFITEKAAHLDLVALGTTGDLSWPKVALKIFLEKYPALQPILGYDPAKRLEAAHAHVAAR